MALGACPDTSELKLTLDLIGQYSWVSFYRSNGAAVIDLMRRKLRSDWLTGKKTTDSA